jgi:hypothetical protein
VKPGFFGELPSIFCPELERISLKIRKIWGKKEKSFPFWRGRKSQYLEGYK